MAMFSQHTDQVVRANSFRNASRGDAQIERVVMHTAETPEAGNSAEAVAAFFARDSTETSAHYVVDNNSIVGCVDEEDIAFHALGDNDQSIGIELAGRARQTKEEWADDYSRAELALAAKLVADICRRRGIPPRRLTNDQLRNRERGIVSHKQVSDLFGQSIRTDPGPNFPWGKFLDAVRLLMAPKVRYDLVVGDTKLAHSAAVAADNTAARRERLGSFLASRVAMIDKQHEEGKHPRVVRRKA